MSPPTRGDREFQVEGRTYGPLDQCGPVYHNTTLVSLVAPNMHCPGSRGIFVDRTLKWGTQTHLGSAGVNFYAGGDAGAWTFDPKERLDDLDKAWVALELRVTAAKKLKGGSSGRYCINAEASRSQPAGSWKHSVRDLAQCSQIMIVNVAPSSSDAPQPAGKADEGATVTLLTRTQHMLKLLESDDGDNDNLCMNSLWHPIQNHATDASGERAFEPRPVHQALQCFQDALQVLRAARNEAFRSRQADTAPSRQLSQEEFGIAMAHSKNLFYEHFMVNEDLRERYARYKESPLQLTKKEKQQTRNAFRSAFRVWVTKLVGDYTFFTTVMAHGFFEGQQRREFVQALLHEREQKQRGSDDVHVARSDAAHEASDDAHLAGSSSASKDAPVRADREQLRKAALHARLQYKHAEKRSSAARKDPWLAMSKQDRQLMRDLHSGALLHRRQEADECYGQGRDVQTLTFG